MPLLFDKLYIREQLNSNLFNQFKDLQDEEAAQKKSQEKHQADHWSFSLIVPVVAYKIKVIDNNLSSDIIEETIVKLVQLYEKQGLEHGSALNRVSEKTKLDRILVKEIWNKCKQDQDIITGETNKDQFTVEYVFYDVYNKRFYEAMIDEDAYKKCTEEYREFNCNEQYMWYRKCIGEGFKKSLYLQLPDACWNIPTPKPEEILSLWHRTHRSSRYTAKIIDGKADEQKTSKPLCKIIIEEAEKIALFTKIYVSKNNLNELIAANPFRNGTMSAISDIMSKELECKEKQEFYYDLQYNCDSLRLYVEDYLNRPIEGLNIESLSDVEKDFLNKIKEHRWEGLYKALAEVLKVKLKLNSQIALSKEELRKNYFFKLYDLLEKVLGTVFRKYYVPGKKKLRKSQKLDKTQAKETSSQNSDSDRFEAKELIGLLKFLEFEIDEATKKELRQKSNEINYLLKNKDVNADNDAFVTFVGLALQAKADNNHPLWNITTEYADFPTLLLKYLNLRNNAKHDNSQLVLLNENIEALKEMDDFLLEHLLFGESIKSDEEKAIENYNLREQSLIRQAENELLQYPHIMQAPRELQDKARKATKALIDADGSYSSYADNLLNCFMDELLDANSTVQERKVAAFLYPMDRNKANKLALEMMQKYFGDVISFGINPNKVRRQVSRLAYASPATKLYLLLMLLDRVQGTSGQKTLQEIATACPDLIKCFDMITKYRGHNNSANFEEDGEALAKLNKMLLINIEAGMKLLMTRGE